MNLAAKFHFFYTHYGLWRTLPGYRTPHRPRFLLRLPATAAVRRFGDDDCKRERESLCAELGESKARNGGSPGPRRVVRLTLRDRSAPGIGASIEVKSCCSARRARFSSRSDPRRAGGFGWYSIFFDKPLSVSDAGRLRPHLQPGVAGEIRLGVADRFLGAIGTGQPVSDRWARLWYVGECEPRHPAQRPLGSAHRWPQQLAACQLPPATSSRVWGRG